MLRMLDYAALLLCKFISLRRNEKNSLKQYGESIHNKCVSIFDLGQEEIFFMKLF